MVHGPWYVTACALKNRWYLFANLHWKSLSTIIFFQKVTMYMYINSFFAALLKNLISSSDLTQMLMTLDLNNLTLLTSLKKLIINKDSDLQRSALYVLSCILSSGKEEYRNTVLNSDIIGRLWFFWW